MDKKWSTDENFLWFWLSTVSLDGHHSNINLSILQLYIFDSLYDHKKIHKIWWRLVEQLSMKNMAIGHFAPPLAPPSPAPGENRVKSLYRNKVALIILKSLLL